MFLYLAGVLAEQERNYIWGVLIKDGLSEETWIAGFFQTKYVSWTVCVCDTAKHVRENQQKRHEIKTFHARDKTALEHPESKVSCSISFLLYFSWAIRCRRPPTCRFLQAKRNTQVFPFVRNHTKEKKLTTLCVKYNRKPEIPLRFTVYGMQRCIMCWQSC